MRLSRPEVTGWYGMASATYVGASQAAMRMLELGGNAFDGAVAGGFALQAIAPHLNGPAGDVAILFHDGQTGHSKAVCGQGPTPKAATLSVFEDLGLDVVPGTGLLPAVVPGAFDAWLALLAEKGTLPLATVLEPALCLWRKGIVVDDRLHATLEAASSVFKRFWPTSEALFLPNGTVPERGSILRNVRAAETFEMILKVAEGAGSDRLAQIDAARSAWSDGFVAESIDHFCRDTQAMDVSGKVHGALLCGDDLSGWRANFEDPCSISYGGYKVLKCDSWTQGPVLLQALNLLPAGEAGWLDPNSANFIHRVAEAMKLAYADREAFYGDPVGTSVPMKSLLSEDYAITRRAQIAQDANNDWRPGDIGDGAWHLDYSAASSRAKGVGLLAAYGGGEPTVQAIQTAGYGSVVNGDTCYLAVADQHGNMVSATPSGGWLQSSPAIPSLGFPLGTRAQMMWLDADAPSGLKPGVRPRSTLSPTLVLKADGTAHMACGTPGGDQQDQWQLSFLLRVLVHNQGLQEAIEAPSFHSEHWPSSFYPRHATPGKIVVEGRYSEETISDLTNRGHLVSVGEDWSEGRLCAVGRDADGLLRGAANPRGGMGYAVGR